ncbi:hypothetical protein TrVE_jg2831 [Triparma verrucosa]|uniref:Short-chain dehydrogenase/reductase 3 n=1 Tax=Triparma verrucosa TaxID=1606542 RepID=A0A9W7BB87_9STRA|nr:hypothetical protein TrVE_jg2831 [Triparma verrucosa]
MVKNVYRDYIAPRSLTGKVVVITGAGSGIGKEMSIKFAKAGCIVVLLDLSLPAVDAVKAIIESDGGKAHAYVCDVTSPSTVYSVAASIKNEVGEVWCLVNNAGIVSGKSIFEVPDALASKTLAVNTESHFWTVKAFVPGMIEKNDGCVVTVASAAGLVGVAGLGDYCASKWGARGFNDALRLELRKMRKYGVKTLLVCPYFINTGMFDGVNGSNWPFGLILPMLQPTYVGDMIIKAVRRGQPELRMPRLMYVSDLLHFALPVWLKDLAFEIIGFSSSMDSFTQTRDTSK